MYFVKCAGCQTYNFDRAKGVCLKCGGEAFEYPRDEVERIDRETFDALAHDLEDGGIGYGCGDSSCVITLVKQGMCTNGGCRCFDGVPDRTERLRLRRGVSAMRERVRELEAEVARLQAQGTLNHN